MANESEESVKDENVDQSGKDGREPEQDAVEPADRDDAAEKRVESEKPVDWKYLSRKHEKQAKENYRNWQDAKSEAEQAGERLQDALIENARLKAQRKHPELSDSDFEEFCKETDPEAIETWADRMAERFGGQSSAQEQKPVGNPKTEKALHADNGGVYAGASGSYKDGYEEALKRIEKRRSARRG